MGNPSYVLPNMAALSVPENVVLVGVGYKRGSGKDTFVDKAVKELGARGVLCEHHSFAGPLKEAVAGLFKFAEGQLLTQEGKEEVDTRWGVTPRRILQVVGTECFRDIMHPNFWIMAAQVRIEEAIAAANGQPLVIFFSDVRFPNEGQFISDLGGLLVNIVRASVVMAEEAAKAGGNVPHASETAMDGFVNWNSTVTNDDTIQDLHDKAVSFVDHLFETRSTLAGTS